MQVSTIRSRLFFLMTLCPFFAEWVCCAISIRYNIELGYVIIPFLMCHCWVDRIIPVTSIYELNDKWDYLQYDLLEMYYDEREALRRPVYSGLNVCTVTFLITEVALFLIPWEPRLMLLFHACSVYYWLLGMLHVRCHEILQHDKVFIDLVIALENFRAKSIFGFLVQQRGRGRARPFYPGLSILFSILGVVIAYILC